VKSRLFILSLIAIGAISLSLFLFDTTVGKTSVQEIAAEASPAEPQLPGKAKLISNEAPPALQARAFLSAWLRPDGQLEILTSKNGDLRWPIASITKLFTASIASETLDQDSLVTFQQDDFSGIADHGYFQPGQTFKVSDLMVSLLLDSSNDAADALARMGGGEKFIDQMNGLARRLKLSDTALFNPSGLDPEGMGGVNYSSVNDLSKLAQYLLKKKSELLATSRLPGAIINLSDGTYHHQARSTNELLLNQSWSERIVGGKTGSTDLAGKNLILILRTPTQGGYLISVVLGSPDHFREMSELLNWVHRVYQL
jgi:D-alanyl-D-alanine carboxypeptidase